MEFINQVSKLVYEETQIFYNHKLDIFQFHHKNLSKSD